MSPRSLSRRPRPPRQHLLCRLVLASTAVPFRPCRRAAAAIRWPWSSWHVLPCPSRLHQRSSGPPFSPPFTPCRSSILHGPFIPHPPGRAVLAGPRLSALLFPPRPCRRATPPFSIRQGLSSLVPPLMPWRQGIRAPFSFALLVGLLLQCPMTGRSSGWLVSVREGTSRHG